MQIKFLGNINRLIAAAAMLILFGITASASNNEIAVYKDNHVVVVNYIPGPMPVPTGRGTKTVYDCGVVTNGIFYSGYRIITTTFWSDGGITESSSGCFVSQPPPVTG
ncbi:hypothetical protein E7T06_16070 [Deinococcus sp. Arct2-2]|uniref:hypothetical protein n=1 Tax=Deinococcus sp. Arct2-2 TaxID=2568653 RepID=UPI0010A4E1EA|nr:hypothetical protein [Deinococcus sp. Arct2-2]THF68531.1 hypothetical protein E7T06_16070 [Deinococcus sp. Arct2-2]